MTRIQRRLLIDTSVIGITLTLFVAILDLATNALQSLEDLFYDSRAAYCQHWAKPPTDKLVHIDIDDASLQAVGQWPWPRTDMGQLLEEIDRAGARAIAMDIIFPEPAQPRDVKIDGQVVHIDDDANFAASIAKVGKVLVPVSVSASSTASPIYKKIRDYLMADLELSDADCYQRLLADPDHVLPLGSKFPVDIFIAARREAMNARISEQVEKRKANLPEIRKTLLPKTDPEFTSSPLVRLLHDEFEKVRSSHALRRFMMPIPEGMGPLATYSGELASIAPLTEAAAYGGYVDYLQTGRGGTVRAIPLLVNFRGQLFPQMDLSLACAVLGVDIRTIRIARDEIVIPRPPGRSADIRIPVRAMHADQFGGDVGMFAYVPVRGNKDWETIFDHPSHQKPELHVSMAAVWDVYLMRDRLARNNANIDRALRVILDDDPPIDSPDLPRLGLDGNKYKEYLASKPAPEDTAARRTLVDWTLQQLKETGMDAIPKMKDSELPKVPGTDRPDPREIVKRNEVAYAVASLSRGLDQNKKFEELLKNRRALLKDKIAGRGVLIGWAATAKTDFFPTAIQPSCPGVVIHGMLYNGIMTGDLWKHAPKWVTFIITVLIGLSVTVANGFLKPIGALGVTLVLAVAYLLVNGYLLFDYGNVCVGVAGPVVALGSVWSTGAVAAFLIEAAERARITKRFSSYVDQKLVDFVIENPDVSLDGQVREMSVIFTDLAGFTTLSEKLREKTVPILSDYLGVMVPIIRRNDGFVNKFLGDGIMCFYNAPRDDADHAAHAVRTCLEMQVAMKKFAEELVAKGLPSLAMRCGVSTGNMVVGDSGPADACDYTVLGDAVNFASRLEGANKATGTHILISQRTSELVADKFLLRPVGRLLVVGKSEGLMTYEPLVLLDEATPEQMMETAMCAEMVAAYVARDFARCIEVADRMDAQFNTSKLAALYRKTSKLYLEEPPGPEFTGNLILTEK